MDTLPVDEKESKYPFLRETLPNTVSPLSKYAALNLAVKFRWAALGSIANVVEPPPLL